MSDSSTLIIVAVIAALPPTVMGVVTWLQGRKTHATFNSKMDELLKTTRLEAFASGKAEEREKNDKVAQAEALVRAEMKAETKS